MSDGNVDIEKPENLRTIYRELCSSYRAIDDFSYETAGISPLSDWNRLIFSINGQGVSACGVLIYSSARASTASSLTRKAALRL